MCGDPEVLAQFEHLREKVLQQRRKKRSIARDVKKMRDSLLKAHPNTSDLFDLKHDRGGIIDIEFMVQLLVLTESNKHKCLTQNVGNSELLNMCAEIGLIDNTLGKSVSKIYLKFRQRQHMCRLSGSRYSRIARGDVADDVELVNKLWVQTIDSVAS